MRSIRSLIALAALVAPLPLSAAPQAAASAETAQGPFTIQEVMVPVRDGARLQTVIFTPRDAAGPLPILLTRTPYGVQTEAPKTMPKSWAALARDGYIFVQQSMRGRFKSDGRFTLSTAVHPGDLKATDEASDTYDTIDWLIHHVPRTTGKVGMLGISYPGFAAAVPLARPHPALKAVAPQAAWIDYWQNDDLHRNGALRLSYATDWLYMIQHDKDDDATFKYDSFDTYDWFLKMGTASAIDDAVFKGTIPMFSALVAHPDHDSFYTGQRWSDALGTTTVPTLNVAGYWDQEDPWGSWQIFAKERQNDPHHLALMVAGPWAHGWWSRPGTDSLGPINYGVDTGTSFLEEVQAPFFAYWLHGKGARPGFALKSFQSGSWMWKTYPQWPVAATPTALYLRGDGTLSFDGAGEAGACRSWISDPANPVPFRPRPISPTYPGPEWQWWEAHDQRFLQGRSDVMSWTSAPLSADLTVTGKIAAELMASTSGTDSDMIVKLIDVYPDTVEADPRAHGDYTASLNGYQLPIAMEVRRGRFLNSDTQPRALVPDQITAWDVPLRDHDHVFKAGHKIMVQVQSSWFPVTDRNPQSFVPNIARARPQDFVTATQRVCTGSKIVLPVVR